MGAALDVLPKKDGATYTRRALEWAYSDIFQKSSNPGSQYIILITGNQPSHDQSPCKNGKVVSSTLQAILDAGIIYFWRNIVFYYCIHFLN